MIQQLLVFLAVTTAYTAAYVPSFLPEHLAKYSHSVVDDSTKATCDTTMLNQCTLAFYNQFAPGPIPFSNETVFQMALQQYLNVQGVDGWANIKTWMNTLVTCVGGQQAYFNCYNWTGLMSAWNINDLTAKQWNVRFLSLDYDCGPGYPVLIQNFYCIQGVAMHEGPVIQQCRANFTAAQTNQPSMTCQNIVNYLTCVEYPYITHCGPAAGGLVCHGERIAYYVYNPECASQAQLHCQGAPGKK
uniref:Uncharacterized protein n=1 Tax=Plectus sambesii TaxID=2011161 RepID=A0A914X3K6_9BILA